MLLMVIRVRTKEPRTGTLLDRLPPELLLHIFSWLDWRSLLTLECVSAHCRDAVTLHLGRLRLARVDESVCREFSAEQLPGQLLWMLRRASQPPEPVSVLTVFLSKMVQLRELQVNVSYSMKCPQELLTALVSASGHWPLLERLELTWNVELTWNDKLGPDHSLLRQLCANCVRLTSVSLTGEFTDRTVKAVVKKLPELRTLHVNSCKVSGSFISRLPTGLQNLSVEGPSLGSWPQLSDLVLCQELRSLDLQTMSWSGEAARLVPILIGCVQLESLSLNFLNEDFVSCLPPEGLPTLRHLTVSVLDLSDAYVGWLVERLPGLESVSLGWCPRVTPQGLAPLGRLPALSALRLGGDTNGCVSDWLLTQLSAAPLVELGLLAELLLDEEVCKRLQIPKAITVDGLLNLVRNCKTLRLLVLHESSELKQVTRISCGSGVQERDVAQSIRLFMCRVVTSCKYG